MIKTWRGWLFLFSCAAVLAGAGYGQRLAWAQQGVFQADNTLSVTSYIVANNTTAVQICSAGCRVYQVDAFNNATTLAYLKLYNQATIPTCGTPTPQWRGMIPFGSSSSGGGFSLPWVNGDSYSLGAWACVTTGIADNDTGAPAATTYIINVHYKKVNP